MERVLSYPQAIREATDQAMERDPSVLVAGLGVDDFKGILGTTVDLAGKYGPARVLDTPLSEDAMTGAAIGMALAGMRPIHVHIRMDFLMLAMNQLINVAAKTHYMYGGQCSVPLVIRASIGKSWGQGAQHSQAFHSFFMHVPGLKVVAPATPYDAKGTLLAALSDSNPVVIMEHRLLYYQKGPVPSEEYKVLPGKARLLTTGSDVTLVGISYMQLECFRAAAYLKEMGVSAEVIDPIWLSPLDMETIAASVRKTRNLCVVDNGWLSCGASAEIITRAVETLQEEGCAFKIKRLGFAPVTCPPTPPLEDLFYPNARSIAAAACALVRGEKECPLPAERAELKAIEFKGPF